MNSSEKTVGQKNLLRLSNLQVALIVFLSGILIWAFSSGIEHMMERWDGSEEYGYGYMIPFIVGFFIWQKKNVLETMEFTGSKIAVLFVIIGGLFLVLGELATLFIVVQYAFLVTMFGVILSFTGWRVFKVLLPALCIFVFMIPLPGFLYQGLSSQLQLISSQLGVEVIRLFGISVFLEGNVIDLGVYKLQVVEACSGLRYLFPLAALSYMAAYIYKGSFWKKAILFISSAPITVLMNSFRIGVIGVLVEHYGVEQAEGFLHDFEGWIVFMACMVLLVAEMWLLCKIGKEKLSLVDAFEVQLPEEPENASWQERILPFSFKLVIPIVLVIAMLPILFDNRTEVEPERESFTTFPLNHNGWQGQLGSIEKNVIETLQFDDYIMANFRETDNASHANVNLYIAYYKSQRKGASIHSPRSCIPGGGWEIQAHNVNQITLNNDKTISVNRLLIQKGTYKQLVYYWFDQRGRTLTNEYLVKWYLFWDALNINRTDGALIRLTTLVPPGVEMEDADNQFKKFINDYHEKITEYIPE